MSTVLLMCIRILMVTDVLTWCACRPRGLCILGPVVMICRTLLLILLGSECLRSLLSLA